MARLQRQHAILQVLVAHLALILRVTVLRADVLLAAQAVELLVRRVHLLRALLKIIAVVDDFAARSSFIKTLLRRFSVK